MATDKDTYEPTPSERKLLDCLLNPEHRNLTITALAEQAGISRDIYYKAFKKPEFVEYYTTASKNLVTNCLGPVINACVDKAKEGSHPHIKTILEMAGLHQDSLALKGDKDNPLETKWTVEFIGADK